MTEQIQEKKDWREHYILFMLDVEAKNGEKVYFLTKQGNHASFTREQDEYTYERHTCPTNFIRTAAIATLSEKGEINGDPHGIFKFVSKITVEEGDKIINARNPVCPQESEMNRLAEHLLSLAKQKKEEHAELVSVDDLVNKTINELPSTIVADVSIGHLTEEKARQGWSWPITVTFSDKIPK
jgi:hypothetical protein